MVLKANKKQVGKEDGSTGQQMNMAALKAPDSRQNKKPDKNCQTTTQKRRTNHGYQ
jgi:hypothetical protein